MTVEQKKGGYLGIISTVGEFAARIKNLLPKRTVSDAEKRLIDEAKTIVDREAPTGIKWE